MTDSNASTNDAEATDTKTVEITRLFEVSAGLVWEMWTDAEHFAAWYGPMGAEVTVAEMDVKVGGRRLVGMKVETPNGPVAMWFVGEFVEVAQPERLVYTESMADADGNVKTAAEMGMPDDHPTETRVIVELTDDNGRTTMSMTHEGVPAGSPGAQGWDIAFDKLEIHVAAAIG